MEDSLKSRALGGLFWSFLDGVGLQGVRLIITIILARILQPEVFGQIAMVIVVILLAKSVINSGFSAAIIRKKDLTHRDECSVFYFNIVTAFIIIPILYYLAPDMAIFYSVPDLSLIIRALSLIVIFESLSNVHIALLTKRINFKTQLKANLISYSISGAIGIIAAYNGFGIWSLVLQLVGHSLLQTILLWLLHDWRPSLVFSISSLKDMFPFGSRLFVSGILDTVFNNIYFVVIGKVFTVADVGYYSRAKGLQELPVSSLSMVVGRVTFPVFCEVQDDKAKLKRGVRQSLVGIATISFPIMVGMAIVAEPLVKVLLTDKWLPSVFYLQLLCVVGLFYPLSAVNLNVLKSQGRSDLFLRLEIIKKMLVAASVYITYRWGINAMILGAITTSIISYFLNTYYTEKLINYSIVEQLADLVPVVFITAIMGFSVFYIQSYTFSSEMVLLISQILLGISIYALLSLFFRRHFFVSVVTTLFKTR